MNRKFWLNLHLYLGLILSITIIMLSITGIYLNHQHDWFHKQNIVYMNPDYKKVQREAKTSKNETKLTMPEAIEKGTESGLYKVIDVKRVNYADHGLGSFFYIHLNDKQETIVVVSEQGEVLKAYYDSAVKKWMYKLHIGIIDRINFIFVNDITAIGIIILTITGIILSIRILKAKRKRYW